MLQYKVWSGSKVNRIYKKIKGNEKACCFWHALEDNGFRWNRPAQRNSPVGRVGQIGAGFLFGVNIDILGTQFGVHDFLAAIKPIITGKHETDAAGDCKQYQSLGTE